MNIHKNARTAARSRGQIMARELTQRKRPAAVGVRERTVRKRLAGYTREAAGLADRSCRPRRPRRSPIATPPPADELGGAPLRRPGAQMAQALHPSASTVALMAVHT